MSALRGLPRTFVPGVGAEEPFELPAAELDKLRKVLRLESGSEIAVLPNDGTLLRCRLEGRRAVPLEQIRLATESPRRLVIAQALPKGDKLDEIVRACTEIGVAEFILFPAERSVVKWEPNKLVQKLGRLETIAMEACEVSFRARLPRIRVAESLREILERLPQALVLSEVEGEARWLPTDLDDATLVVGPEGGWSPKELALIGDRGVTLGPRVLRVDHAAPAAAALLLLRP